MLYCNAKTKLRVKPSGRTSLTTNGVATETSSALLGVSAYEEIKFPLMVNPSDPLIFCGYRNGSQKYLRLNDK